MGSAPYPCLAYWPTQRQERLRLLISGTVFVRAFCPRPTLIHLSLASGTFGLDIDLLTQRLDESKSLPCELVA